MSAMEPSAKIEAVIARYFKPVVVEQGYFDDLEDAQSFEDRIGRCYELAGHAVVFGEIPHGTVVHGSWHGAQAPQRIGHAWVEWTSAEGGGHTLVWEPITGEVFEAASFYTWSAAEPEASYSKAEAAARMVRTGHYGRWHESEYP